ncbi:hypothetical protein NF212_17960 [Parasalinivibrio latis]|uniref:hypothetical protein n=1 Tax=Parasalinivibrio latis TaxID=2952610 RepID=UPI0030DFC61B
MKTIKERGLVTVSVDILGANTFVFQLPEEVEGFIDTESVDAFLLLYIWHAMELGVPLTVDAPVSKALTENIAGLQDVFAGLCPSLKIVKITCNNPQSSWNRRDTLKSTGFSGGVDSWFTLCSAIQKNSRFDCLLFSNTGQHGVHRVGEVFESRYKTALEVMSTVSTPLIKVDTNIDEVLLNNFMQTHSIRNLACALMLQGGIGSYLYSSAYDFIPERISPNRDMATVEFFLFPLIKTERMAAKTAGLGLSRTGKLVYLAKRPEFNGKLYVCTEKRIPARNCGTCFKCRRTLLLLSYLGLESIIDASFDSPAFKRRKRAMELGVLVAAQTSVPEHEVADIIYRDWGVRAVFIKPVIAVLAAIKAYLPKALEWRIKNRYPYLW